MSFHITTVGLTDEVEAMFLRLVGAEGCNDTPFPLPGVRKATESDFWWWNMQHGFKAHAMLGPVLDEPCFFGWPAFLHVYLADHERLIGGGFAVAVVSASLVRDLVDDHVVYLTWGRCVHDWVREFEQSDVLSMKSICRKCRASWNTKDRPLGVKTP